jgi:hypothetical protein
MMNRFYSPSMLSDGNLLRLDAFSLVLGVKLW